MAEATPDVAFRATADLSHLGALLAPCAGLAAAIQDERPAARGDTPDGTQALYP